MKIGIYGGSFNPIHRGHTALASSLVRQGWVDELWFMVSPQNPLKFDKNTCADEAKGVPTYDDRVAMSRLATKDLQNVKVSDFESTLPIPSYTITTLTALRSRYPQHQFCLVIGEDNWRRFDQWYKSDEIKRNHPVLVLRRETNETDSAPRCEAPTGTCQFVTTKLYDISSTEIRNRLREGKSIKGLVHSRVEHYISKHKLYQ